MISGAEFLSTSNLTVDALFTGFLREMASQAELRALMRRAQGAPVPTPAIKSAASVLPLRAAPAPRVEHPLLRYDGDGRLVCKVCSLALGTSASLWEPHLASRHHAASVARLRAQAAQAASQSAATGSSVGSISQSAGKSTTATALPAGFFDSSVASSNAGGTIAGTGSSSAATAAPAAIESLSSGGSMAARMGSVLGGAAAQPLSSNTGSSSSSIGSSISMSAAGRSKAGAAAGSGSSTNSAAASSAAVPAGFFDDPLADAKARNVDLTAVARVAEAETWAEFESFASAVGEQAARSEADVGAAYVERQSDAALENAMYRGRLDVVRFVRSKLAGGRDRAGIEGLHASKDVASSAGDDDGEEEVDGVAGAEFVGEGGSLSLALLTAPNAAASHVRESEVASLLRQKAEAEAALLRDSSRGSTSATGAAAAAVAAGSAGVGGKRRSTVVAAETSADDGAAPAGKRARIASAADGATAAVAPSDGNDGNASEASDDDDGAGHAAGEDDEDAAEDEEEDGAEDSDEEADAGAGAGWDSLVDWRSRGASSGRF